MELIVHWGVVSLGINSSKGLQSRSEGGTAAVEARGRVSTHLQETGDHGAF